MGGWRRGRRHVKNIVVSALTKTTTGVNTSTPMAVSSIPPTHARLQRSLLVILQNRAEKLGGLCCHVSVYRCPDRKNDKHRDTDNRTYH